MNPELFHRASALLDELLELAADARPAALARLAPDDPALAAELAALLALDAQAAGPLERPLDALAEAAFAAREEARALEPRGRRIGPYEVLAEIGRGGMGTVYLAARADGQFSQRVALKLIKRGLDSDEVVARFLAERQILAGLEHPAIARLLDGGLTAEGQPYFALEHVDGLPIDRYCTEHALGLAARLQLVMAVCRAVEHAHRNLVVHRDLKPRNILVMADGAVKLLDFGIAKLLAADGGGDEPTELGHRLATPEYAAPEQLAGGAITTAADVYGLGVVLYEVLTGSRPLAREGMSRPEIERAVLASEPERASAVLARQLPGALAAAEVPHGQRARELDLILTTALRKEPARRYSSAEALRADLERFLAGRPLVAHPDSLAYRAAKLVSRHRLVVATLAISALAVLSGLGVALQQAHLARREAARQRTVSEFLAGLFEVSDPDVAQGETITARALLDRGARRFESELASEPALAAEMMRLVGGLYRKLGLYQPAEELLERAVTLSERTSGADSAAAAETSLALAQVAIERGDLAAGDRELARARERFARSTGSGSVPYALTQLATADLAARRGQLDAAEALTREAIARLSATGGADYARALAQLGFLELVRGKPAAAEPLYRQALALYRRLPGGASSQVSLALTALATVKNAQGDNAGAVPLLAEALAIDRRLFGGESLNVAIDLTNLGTITAEEGELTKAEAMLREALTIRERGLPAGSPHLAVSYHNLGSCLRAQGRAAEAAPLLARAWQLTAASVAPAHPSYARALGSYAGVLADLGRFGEAEPLLRQARELFAGSPFAGSAAAIDVDASLARVLLRSHRCAEARPLVRSVEERAAEVYPLASDPRRARLLAGLGDCDGR